MNSAPTINAVLDHWNHLDPTSATEAILPCNGSHAWAAAVAARAPFDTPAQIFAAADEVWRTLPAADWQQAFDSHPRIGEKDAPTASAQSLAWSAKEQSAEPHAAAAAALIEGNRAYEARFGRIFLVCATGKTPAEMLAILHQRLTNDPSTELLESAEQQRQITQLRLRKWLSHAQEQS